VKRASDVENNTRLKPADVVAFRMFMLARGLRAKDVARRINRDVDQVTNVISGNARSWPICAEINREYRQKFFFKPSRRSSIKKQQRKK
jgi:hypothetical protein